MRRMARRPLIADRLSDFTAPKYVGNRWHLLGQLQGCGAPHSDLRQGTKKRPGEVTLTGSHAEAPVTLPPTDTSHEMWVCRKPLP